MQASQTFAADSEHVVDAVLAASRAIVAMAVRSLSAVSEDVTLTQYRVLVVLASRGEQTVAALADELGVSAPTASRMCDRLVRDGLITRSEDPGDRRRVSLVLTKLGSSLLEDVTAARRVEIAHVLAALSERTQRSMIAGLHQFATAAGEIPEQEWSAGWKL
jgi:DNA-binding MarR family transcriptional regulator